MLLFEGGRKIKFGEERESERERENGSEDDEERARKSKSPLDLDWTYLISFSLPSCVTRVHKVGDLYILCHRRHGENCGAKCFHSWPPAGARRGGAWPHRRIQHQSLTTCANHGSEREPVPCMCVILIKIYFLTASVWSPNFKFIKSVYQSQKCFYNCSCACKRSIICT